MPLTEQDIQQLEEHLDGVLSGDERNAVQQRIAANADWSAAMAVLSGERVIRSKVFAALEPAEAHANDLAESLIRAAQRAGEADRDTGVSPVRTALELKEFDIHESSLSYVASTGETPVLRLNAAVVPDRGRLWRPIRLATAAAACIALGVIGGWALRSRSSAVNVASNPAPTTPAIIGPNSAKVAEVVAYEVKLTDETGRVTAVQRFDSLKQAREFADDLSSWQQRQKKVREGAAVVVADKF